MANEEQSSAVQKSFKRHEYSVNGVRTVVQVGGQGRPVVYWHGAGAWHGIDFARSWTERMKVIAPWHPGWGDSADAPELDSMNEYLLHYLDLFDQLNLGQFDLVGFSLGGWMAAEFAVAHPQRLRHLVLVAPAGLPDPENPGPPIGSWSLEEMYSHLVNDRSVLAPHLPRTAEEQARHADTIAREMSSTRRLAARGPFNPNLERWLHRVTMPTLLVWSKDDRLAPVSRAKKWMQRLPNAKLALFERAGHLVLDELAEARDCVAKFLTQSFPMKLYSNQDGSELMRIEAIERNGNRLVIRGKVFGAMPMSARLEPEELRNGLKLLSPRLVFFLLTFFFRRSRPR